MDKFLSQFNGLAVPLFFSLGLWKSGLQSEAAISLIIGFVSYWMGRIDFSTAANPGRWNKVSTIVFGIGIGFFFGEIIKYSFAYASK